MRIVKVRVGDVLRLERAAVAIDPAQTYTHIGIRSFGKGIFHYDPMPGAELPKLRFFEIKPHRLVISNIKGWEGAIAVSTEGDAKCVASNRFLTYTPKPDGADVDYLRYFFLSEPGLPLIQRASPGSADRNRTLAIDRFEALEIPLPEISEQRRIAIRLDDVSRGIANVRRLGAVNLEIGRAFGPALIDPSAPLIALSEVLTPSRDSIVVEPAGTYQPVGVLSFGKGLFAREPIQGTDTKYRSLNPISAGQLVFARLNAWEGALAVVTEEFAGKHVSSEFPVFDLDVHRILPAYLAVLCRSSTLWDSLMRTARGVGARSGARRLRVHPDQLLKVKIPLPMLDSQERIASLSTRIDEVLAGIEWRRRQLDVLEKSLLNQAFAGLL